MNKVSLTGILKLSVYRSQIPDADELLRMIEESTIAKPILEDDLHITLIHQFLTKQLQLGFSQHGEWIHVGPSQMPIMVPVPRFGERIVEVRRGDRRSWLLVIKNQEHFRVFNRMLCTTVGAPFLEPEPYRVFHCTVANLTGNPMDSVGDIEVGDLA